MIVKVHSRGSGGGSGPVQYLLGKNGDREDARLDQGNPVEIIELIDGLKFAQKYTSGVLSFAESDLSEFQKKEIMEGFEKTIFTGLDKDQYSILWVQHLDKGRLELNFVIPNVELLSGKRLQPYYDRADRTRVNAFQEATNGQYELADPNDPIRRRELTTSSDLPRDIASAQESITDGLLSLANQGLVKNRQDVISRLEAYGFTVAKISKNSISIKNPELNKNGKQKQNIRLRGALYEESFKFGKGLQSEIEGAGRRFREQARQRFEESLATYRRSSDIKREYNIKRFERQKEQAFGVEQSNAITAAGVAVRSPSISLGVVSVPKSGSYITSGAANLGELHVRVRGGVSLPDQGGKLNDGIGERTIIGCREIGKRAGERTHTNGLSGEVFAENTGRIFRKIRAISDAIEQVVERIKLSLSNKMQKNERSGPTLGR